MTTFAVTYTYDDRSGERDRVRPEHRAFLRHLLDAGVLLASGPLAPSVRAADGGEREVPDGALLLLRVADAETALAVLADDPFRSAGLVSGAEARAWDPVIGPLSESTS